MKSAAIWRLGTTILDARMNQSVAGKPGSVSISTVLLVPAAGGLF